jgi:hypothetical protein
MVYFAVIVITSANAQNKTNTIIKSKTIKILVLSEVGGQPKPFDDTAII